MIFYFRSDSPCILMKGWISHCENVPSNIGKVLKKSLSGFKKNLLFKNENLQI